jgi:hypothetical protein
VLAACRAKLVNRLVIAADTAEAILALLATQRAPRRRVRMKSTTDTEPAIVTVAAGVGVAGGKAAARS